MKRNNLIIIAALPLLALAACSKSDTTGLDSREMQFNLSLPATKATASAFESGDKVSLFAVEYDGESVAPVQVGGNFINNEALTYDGSKWSAARTLYWSDKPCDFYGLYPYQSNLTSVDEYPFEVATDQSGDGYEASDLLFAKAEKVSRTDGAVNLQFRHILSKLVVKVEKGAKFEGEIPDDIVSHIYNTNVECAVSLNTGSVEKNAFGAKKTITMKKLSNDRFEAVLVPQNLEKTTPLVELTMGGIAYLLNYSLSFRAGYVHTLTVTLNTSPDQEQIEISIDPGTEDWS
jgi:hypothetical protein